MWQHIRKQCCSYSIEKPLLLTCFICCRDMKSVFQAQYQRGKMDFWMRGVQSICLSVWLYERSREVRRVEIRLIPQAAHLRYTAGAGNSNTIIVTISARRGSSRCPCFAGLCLFRMHIYLSSLVKCLSCQALCDPKLLRVRQAGGPACCSSAVLKFWK